MARMLRSLLIGLFIEHVAGVLERRPGPLGRLPQPGRRVRLAAGEAPDRRRSDRPGGPRRSSRITAGYHRRDDGGRSRDIRRKGAVTPDVSTPPFAPGTLGPVPRPDDQSLWDPDKQAMGAEQRRELQNERLRRMIDGIFTGPVPLFRDKLRSRRSVGRRGHLHRRRPRRRPPHRQAGPARLGGGRTAVGRVPLHRSAPGGAARHVDRHHRPADHHRVDQAGPVDRVRVRRPQLVADGLSPGHHRDPCPSGLSLRRRGHAAGDLRVSRPPLPVGPAPRHRRARRAGGPVLDPGHPRRPLHGLRHRAVHRGGDQARHPARGRRAHRTASARPVSGSAAAGCRS